MTLNYLKQFPTPVLLPDCLQKRLSKTANAAQTAHTPAGFKSAHLPAGGRACQQARRQTGRFPGGGHHQMEVTTCPSYSRAQLSCLHKKSFIHAGCRDFQSFNNHSEGYITTIYVLAFIQALYQFLTITDPYLNKSCFLFSRKPTYHRFPDVCSRVVTATLFIIV